MGLSVSEVTTPKGILNHWGLSKDVEPKVEGDTVELTGTTGFRGTLTCAIRQMSASGHKVHNRVQWPHLV